ncbi:Uncharacterized membrane protein YckC, RDD family [Alteribacillus persepolensis]|uniref:Uncharacterized membrane protein YckC, RDD family n=1 Tax=Alteribacillus persepolensis TaxID=568899 RepID=A0A1G8BFR1_9BACI|nr:RDD family protein [Alteribacillus persepolensis]SDH32008.1 Uncharacterized membrane protein YckC, RDD family [Alteribacillus persepolensis]
MDKDHYREDSQEWKEQYHSGHVDKTDSARAELLETEEEQQEETVKSRRYAGFWMRFWAYIIDLLIVFSLNGLLLSPLMFMDQPVTMLGFFTLQGLLSTVTAYLYFLFMTKWLNQTLGKMIFGLKVVHRYGHTLSWSDLLFREVVGRFIHRSLVFTNIIYIVVGFTNEKQGIHDMFADTRVVHVD